VKVHQVGFNFNFNLYKMHGEYNIEYNNINNVKFDLLTVVLKKNRGFLDVTPWQLVNSYLCFRGATCQKMNALSCSETSVTVYQPTGYNYPEVLNLK
jgi:hypothetical protein